MILSYSTSVSRSRAINPSKSFNRRRSASPSRSFASIALSTLRLRRFNSSNPTRAVRQSSLSLSRARRLASRRDTRAPFPSASCVCVMTKFFVVVVGIIPSLVVVVVVVVVCRATLRVPEALAFFSSCFSEKHTTTNHNPSLEYPHNDQS